MAESKSSFGDVCSRPQGFPPSRRRLRYARKGVRHHPWGLTPPEYPAHPPRTRAAQDCGSLVQMAERTWGVGEVFSRLTVVRRGRSENGRQYWVCDCSCGTKGLERRADKLVDGRVKSCGCLNREMADAAHAQALKTKQDRELLREAALQRRQAEIQQQRDTERNWTPADRTPTQRLSNLEKKHDSVKGTLHYMETPKEDPLWSLRYYAELILEDECHFCRGPLEDKTHSLTLRDDILGFAAFNAIPTCKLCMLIRMTAMDSLSFADMELLGPSLELIRLRRGQLHHY
jgi:hypothetical protein